LPLLFFFDHLLIICVHYIEIEKQRRKRISNNKYWESQWLRSFTCSESGSSVSFIRYFRRNCRMVHCFKNGVLNNKLWKKMKNAVAEYESKVLTYSGLDKRFFIFINIIITIESRKLVLVLLKKHCTSFATHNAQTHLELYSFRPYSHC